MIQLRPPADADNYRVQAGRFGDRFYTDPLPADDTWAATTDDDIYPAISTVKKASGHDWSKAMAKRLARAPSQLVEIGNLDDEFERKQRINLISDAGLGKASGRGTVVHAHAEAVLMNRMPLYELDETTKPYIRTLDTFFAGYNPKLVAAEFVAIHRTLNDHGVARGNEYLGYGGTGDAAIEIDGKLYLVDWKSRAEDSKHSAYAEEGAQVAAYGRADYWIVGCDESPHGAKRITPPELAGGLIVSIKPDSFECYPINLDEGFAYWRDLHSWWQARRSERRPIGRKWAPRVVVDAPPVTSELVTEEQAKAETPPVKRPPTKERNRARFDALDEVGKTAAREAFSRAGVDPRKADGVGMVARILTEIEERPSLREMQEERAAAWKDQREETEAVEPEPDTTLEDEGGEASEEAVATARLKFDMVLDDDGREWTGFRVKEANAAEVPFRISEVRSVKRACIYGALCDWAAFRMEEHVETGETINHLLTDEAEGNIEFAGMLFTVDQEGDTEMTLGQRLGLLSTEQAQEFATLVSEVVQSEPGEQVATETETQPASQPAGE